MVKRKCKLLKVTQTRETRSLGLHPYFGRWGWLVALLCLAENVDHWHGLAYQHAIIWQSALSRTALLRLTGKSCSGKNRSRNQNPLMSHRRGKTSKWKSQHLSLKPRGPKRNQTFQKRSLETHQVNLRRWNLHFPPCTSSSQATGATSVEFLILC